jgi:hypothetical protein
MVVGGMKSAQPRAAGPHEHGKGSALNRKAAFMIFEMRIPNVWLLLSSLSAKLIGFPDGNPWR